MRRNFVIFLLALPFLAACSSTVNSDSGETQMSVDEFMAELEEVSKPGYLYCAFLRVELGDRSDVPPLLQCNDDSDPTTGQSGIVVVFDDQEEFLVGQDVEVSFETVFAPIDAMARAYADMGAASLESVDLFLVFIDDKCGNTYEVQPNTLEQLGTGQVTLNEAMEQVEMFGDPNCP